MIDVYSPDSPGTAELGASQLTSPLARRLKVARWRDPRLAFGLLLVVGSIVAGSRIIAAADQSVTVAVVTGDMRVGMHISSGDISYAQVRLPTQHHYLIGALPTGSVMTRDIEAGELLPSSAVGTESAVPARYLTVPVSADQIPVGLAAGAVVDVYVAQDPVTGSSSADSPAAALLAERVAVDAVPDDASSFGVSGDTQRVTLVLPVGASAVGVSELVVQIVAAARSGDLVLVGIGQGGS